MEIFMDLNDGPGYGIALGHSIRSGVSYVAVGIVDLASLRVIDGNEFTVLGDYVRELETDTLDSSITIPMFHQDYGTPKSLSRPPSVHHHAGKTYYNLSNTYTSLRYYGIIVEGGCNGNLCTPTRIE